MRFWRESLLARLLIYFLALAIIPLAVVGAIAYVQGQRALQQNILNHLTTTAILKEGEINRWVEGEIDDAVLVAQNPIVKTQAGSLLTEDPASPEFISAYQTLKSYLDDVLVQKTDFLEIFVLRAVGGEVVLSTNSDHEGSYEVTSTFFTKGRKGTYVQNVYPSVSLGKPAMTIATPLRGEQDGEHLGVLAVHLNLTKLDEIMLERGGLGATGETYLVDQFNVFVSEARFGRESFPRGVHTQGIDAALLQKQDGAGVYTNYRDAPVLGAYRWLDDREMALLAEIEQDEALAPARRLAWVTLIVGVVAAGLVSVIAYGVSRQISGPILALAETSTQMAEGDLSQTVEIRRQDEIGTLAQAFNSMAAQLRELVAGLEQRVADRTRDLERRAVQLATAADVGRAAASILELEPLTQRVVQLVRERFDLYYAGLFLLDDAGEYAVLEAGSGEAGRLMKEEGHRLRVGGSSMVGSACAQREARIALDVGEEPVRFDNPLLPDTRSEMALPLMVGDRVLGALDVQSTQQAAFSQEDIAVLQLVANQAAVAVDNARKFSEEAALVEATNPLFRLSRRLTAATTATEVAQAIAESVAETEADRCAVAWFDLSPEGEVAAITFLAGWDRRGRSRFPIGRPLPTSASLFPLPLMMEPLTVEDARLDPRVPEEARQTLMQIGDLALANIPLRMGERPLGFVNVGRAMAGPWSPVALRLYETLADQAAVALERARLLEDSRLRAEQETTLRTLGDQIARAIGMEAVLHSAAEGLSQAVEASSVYIELGSQQNGRN